MYSEQLQLCLSIEKLRVHSSSVFPVATLTSKLSSMSYTVSSSKRHTGFNRRILSTSLMMYGDLDFSLLSWHVWTGFLLIAVCHEIDTTGFVSDDI